MTSHIFWPVQTKDRFPLAVKLRALVVIWHIKRKGLGNAAIDEDLQLQLKKKRRINGINASDFLFAFRPRGGEREQRDDKNSREERREIKKGKRGEDGRKGEKRMRGQIIKWGRKENEEER